MSEINEISRDNTWEVHNNNLVKCRKCPRLVAWREEVAKVKRRAFREWDYWGKPVPGFGDPNARILVLGLAPGAHGSNRTGRMFTGDASGDFLYPALYKAGFASQPNSNYLEDGLSLDDLFITAVCRCAPPANKVQPSEIVNCRAFLTKEMELLTNLQGIVTLGRLAFDQALVFLKVKSQGIGYQDFAHGSLSQFKGNLPWLLASYHPSRQNTQTGKLTKSMFKGIWDTAKNLLV
jgi:uracil-DNA glycosylase family 4